PLLYRDLVLMDLLHQLTHRIKLPVGPDKIYKLHCKRLIVEISIKIEYIDLHTYLRIIMQGGTCTNIKHPLIDHIPHMYQYSIDTQCRNNLISFPRPDVRCWKPDGSSNT